MPHKSYLFGEPKCNITECIPVTTRNLLINLCFRATQWNEIFYDFHKKNTMWNVFALFHETCSLPTIFVTFSNTSFSCILEYTTRIWHEAYNQVVAPVITKPRHTPDFRSVINARIECCVVDIALRRWILINVWKVYFLRIWEKVLSQLCFSVHHWSQS